MTDDPLVAALQDAWGELWLQSDVYLAHCAQRLSPGLTREAMELLLTLRRDGPLAAVHLAGRLSASRSDVERITGDLVARGLVELDGTLVRLTEHAEDELDLARTERDGLLRDELMTWPIEDRFTFVRLLARLAHRDDLVAEVAMLRVGRGG
ncbi:helix-turn-helix domain-containing protein [Nocardioides acrostichi]|uniref:MarR family transcriptional regulator n=1 Tax=Nocardioides acrostichi TaxID=2784339 RepID=A0A930V1G1_9ACTN|nr:hypothetical protein [Nocardioides acrostichi]MBF4161985.1 hypothetical protein [Nocardioides acrostichi]